MVIIAVGIFTLGAFAEHDGNASPTDIESSVTTTMSASPTSDGAVPETTPAPPTGTQPSGSQQYYLADLDYVDVEIEGRPGRCTGGCPGFEKGSARIGPVPYPQSFVTRLDGDGDRSVSSWNALRSCSVFEATVGLTNESDSTAATFTISMDGGTPKVLADTSTGDSKTISIDVEGVNRFTIAAFVSGAEPDHVEAVWGDAVLTCAAGSLG